MFIDTASIVYARVNTITCPECPMLVWRSIAVVTLLSCASIAQAAPVTVGLLGGPGVRELATRLQSSSAVLPAMGPEAVSKARPKLVLFVVNAPDGPMPANREALAFMKQTGIRNVAIVFTETTKIFDPELFGLLIKEVVDLMKQQGFAADQAPIFLDSEAVKTDPALKVGKGLKALQDFIGKAG